MVLDSLRHVVRKILRQMPELCSYKLGLADSQQLHAGDFRRCQDACVSQAGAGVSENGRCSMWSR